MQVYNPGFADGLQTFLRWDPENNKPLEGAPIIAQRESLVSSGTDMVLVKFKLTEHFKKYFLAITAKTYSLSFQVRKEQYFGDIYVRKVEFEETLEELTEKELKQNPEKKPKNILKITKDSPSTTNETLPGDDKLFTNLTNHIINYVTKRETELPNNYPQSLNNNSTMLSKARRKN